MHVNDNIRSSAHTPEMCTSDKLDFAGTYHAYLHMHTCVYKYIYIYIVFYFLHERNIKYVKNDMISSVGRHMCEYCIRCRFLIMLGDYYLQKKETLL